MAVKKKDDGVTVDRNSEQEKAEAKPGFNSYLVSRGRAMVSPFLS